MDTKEKEQFVDKLLKSIEGKQGNPAVYYSAIELDVYHGCDGGYDFLYDFAMAAIGDTGLDITEEQPNA